MDNSIKKRQDLAQRLASAGCSIDLSGTDWHQSGNFDIERKNWLLEIDSAGQGGIDSEDSSGGIRITHKIDILNLLDAINKVLKDGGVQKFIRNDGVEIGIGFSEKRPDSLLISIMREDGNWLRIHKDEVSEFRNSLRDSLSALL